MHCQLCMYCNSHTGVLHLAVPLPLHAPTRLRTIPNLAGTAVAAANFAFNQVSSVAAGWMQDTTLSTITLNGNPMPALQAGFCDGGSTVKTMWLDDMPALTTIHSGAFTGCVNLNFLQVYRGAVLEHVELGSLPTSLTVLLLWSRVAFPEFNPDVLLGLDQLNRFTINSHVRRITKPFPFLPLLTTVTLSQASFTSLPTRVFHGLPSSAIIKVRNSPALVLPCEVGYMEADAAHDLEYCVGIPYYCATDPSDSTVLLSCHDVPEDVDTITLADFNLRHIADDAFARLGRSVAIDLSRNNLTALPPPTVFGVDPATGTLAPDAHKPAGLNLEGNAITTLPAHGLRGVVIEGVLDLRNNGLQELQDGALSGLLADVVDVRGNSLAALTFAQLEGVMVMEELRLRGNPIAWAEFQVLNIGPASVAAATVDRASCNGVGQGLADWHGAHVCTWCIQGTVI